MEVGTLTEDYWLENLKCSNCKNYLSKFPIYLSENNNNICGHCPLPEDKVCIRNHVYEAASQQIEFPCKYHDQGCLEKMIPENLIQHENHCPHKTICCPIAKFTKCNEEISPFNIQRHYEDVHSNFILSNCEFEMPLAVKGLRLGLLKHLDQFLVVILSSKIEENVLNITFQNKNTYLPFEVMIKCGGRSLTMKNEKRNQCEIYLDSLTKGNDNFSSISGKIIVGKQEKICGNDMEVINAALLEMLHCSACSEYLIPPFNLPSQKETLCVNCDNKQKSSTNQYNRQWQFNQYHPYNSSSSSIHASIRITKLDAIAELLNYPCKYRKHGCAFASCPQKIRNHESSCSFSYQTCPTNLYTNCKWNGFGKDLQEHILNNHKQMIINNCKITEAMSPIGTYTHHQFKMFGINSTDFLKCYIMRYSSYFFKLVFCIKEGKFKWTMEVIGECHETFKFELEIVDGKKSGKKIVLAQSCTPGNRKSVELFQNGDEYCYLQHDQVKNFLNQESISFKVRIFQ